jgi:hypothetical protein
MIDYHGVRRAQEAADYEQKSTSRTIVGPTAKPISPVVTSTLTSIGADNPGTGWAVALGPLSHEMMAQQPQIAPRIPRFRNIATHDYAHGDLNIVRQIVIQDLAPL